GGGGRVWAGRARGPGAGLMSVGGLVARGAAPPTETPTPKGLTIRRQTEKDLPPLGEEAELVVYRIAQEAVTNTVRHAGATLLELSLRRSPGGVELRIRDDGRGLGDAPEGAGLRGMRERALLIGATLTLGTGAEGGTDVRLDVPVRNGSA
ncbi:sensor histidine kinase, partial [Streptomyces sp. NPDC057067]|uniref:sensor histidine kinase n=1 Tax=Streptomyces sp. NPDC057067 TaxID=3346013 RepID=UPI0036358DFD